MQVKRNFGQHQQVRSSDLNTLQNYVQAGVDNVVVDALTVGSAYSGFLAAKTGPTEVTLAPGRLYRAGKIYARAAPQAFDFLQQLPVAARKIVQIAAWGSEEDTNVDAVAFLNLATSTPANPVWQPRPHAQDRARVANLGAVVGAESPAPTAPVVDAGMLLVAQIVLTPAGVDSVTMIRANEIANLEEVDTRVEDAERWIEAARPKLASIESDLAKLANTQQSAVATGLLGRILGRLATVEAKSGIPSNAADSDADLFLDDSKSDADHPLYSAKIEEGLRFADDAAAETPIVLFNPFNTHAMISGGVLFPAYDPELRFSIGPATGEDQVSTYDYRNEQFRQKTIARQRRRFGPSFSGYMYAWNGGGWLYTFAGWQQGSYDKVKKIFTVTSGETFEVEPAWSWGDYVYSSRVRQFWIDNWQETNWDLIATSYQIAGAACEETFQAAQDMWWNSIDLSFTQIAATGDVTVLLLECTTTGAADPTKVLGRATTPAAALAKAPAKTKFQFAPPVFLAAGKRYAVRVVTPGNHFLATADGPSFPGGMFFEVRAGYSLANPQKHIVMDVYGCRFRRPYVELEFSALSLSGGITDIDILTGAVAPASTALTFVVESNGVRIPLDAGGADALNAGGNLPNMLKFYGVFQGTPEMMPAIDIAHSRVRVSRPKTALAHISEPHTLAAPSASIRASMKMLDFDANFHTSTMKLLSGADFATETAPSSYSDLALDDGSIERTFVWNLGAAIGAYKLKAVGTTTTALKLFVGALRKSWEL
jgi:hypothetical protein